MSFFNTIFKFLHKQYKFLTLFLYKLAPKTFLLRIVLLLTISFTVLIATAIIWFYDQQWRQIRTALNSYLVKDISLAVTTASKYNNTADMQQALSKLSGQIFVVPKVIDNVEYKTINVKQLSKENSKFYNDLIDVLPKNLVFVANNSANNSLVNLLINVNNTHWLQFNLTSELFYLSSFSLVVYVLLGLCAVLVFIMLQFFRLQVRPLKQLATASKKLGNGQPVPYLKPYGAKEIKEATIAFNTMKEQLQKFVEQRTLMLGAISHDLFTALTRINLLVELQTKEDYSEIKEEVLIMQQMIQSYLDFANGTNLTKEVSHINIKKIIEDVTNKYDNQINISIQNNISSGCTISANQQQIIRVFDNLIANAIKYANKVKITVSNYGNSSVQIDVEDNGAGIPADKYDKVFLPFYKLNQARTPEKSSVGLGLYIVKDIILNHGGTIEIGQSNLGGVKISIYLVK